jgi:hypothetical protein
VACRDYGVRVPIFGARENKRMEAQVMTPVAATVKESTFFHYDVDKPLFFSVLINYSNCEKRIFPAFWHGRIILTVYKEGRLPTYLGD